MSVVSDSLLSRVLGRGSSFLRKDLNSQVELLADRLANSRILVIGAAGSIGSSFVQELVVSGTMKSLHLLDISENNLAEIVRDLRSSGSPLPQDFRTYAIDFGGPEMRALLHSESYDYVLNFSALKHVRSERDPFTLMRLLDVNVLANVRLLNWLEETHRPKKVFAVSSDKAVRSANLMGASKAFMERVYLNRSACLPFASARFANVAFSDGSLLHSFIQRLEKRQPLSAPSDVRRFFISHQEAGQLCLLGCFVCESGEIVFPNFDPEEDMLTFSQIAEEVLKHVGLRPLFCQSEEEALDVASRLDENSKEWPCLFTPSDTSGEKMFEEFLDPAEKAEMNRFEEVGVNVTPLTTPPNELSQALAELDRLRSSGTWTQEQLAAIVERAVPQFAHVKSEKNLDQKM